MDKVLVAKTSPFLAKALSPLQPFLSDATVSEISINEPGKLFIERLGQASMQEINDPVWTEEAIRNLGERVASATDQMVNAERPILSAALPTGERFQCVLPPAAPKGGCISIRKQTMINLDLKGYGKKGAFLKTRIGNKLVLSEGENILASMIDKSPEDFIRAAVKNRVSIVVSGGTSTGKTTFLNALLKEIPSDERLITIEDTAELIPAVPNAVQLIASKGDQGLARVTTQDLVEASLRMRPDRLLLGELRGAETFSFLQAINTGHPGSLTTVHANSARSAYERLALMVMQSGVSLGKSEILDYLKEVIPVVIQLQRGEKGVRVISEIYFAKSEVKP
jgi:type IV secretion system protein VirB11